MIQWYKIDHHTIHGYLTKENDYVCYKITIRLVDGIWMLLSDKLNLYKALSNDVEESKKVAINEIKQKLKFLIQCHSDALEILDLK